MLKEVPVENYTDIPRVIANGLIELSFVTT